MEPTIKLVWNALRARKIQMSRIRLLGMVELIRLTLFTLLLAAALALA
ncbi:hypothetical protein [Hyperthermus butylicus]|nr:hypothetical protein [Hyperthermus butylicus]